jgi:hypothetical protein
VNAEHEVLSVKSRFHPAAGHRAGDVVIRDSGPWTPTVYALLRHLEDVGYAAPRESSARDSMRMGAKSTRAAR